MYIRNPGHMTKMAAMPIYGKNPSKIFSRTGGQISMKLGIKHRWLQYYKLQYYNVYIRAVAGQRSSPDLCFATKFVKIYYPDLDLACRCILYRELFA